MSSFNIGKIISHGSISMGDGNKTTTMGDHSVFKISSIEGDGEIIINGDVTIDGIEMKK